MYQKTNVNTNRKPRKTVLFEASPLKIKIVEDKCENNDDNASPDTSCFSCWPQNDHSSEDGNLNNGNFMEKWFQLITDWEKKIHLDDKQKKSQKRVIDYN